MIIEEAQCLISRRCSEIGGQEGGDIDLEALGREDCRLSTKDQPKKRRETYKASIDAVVPVARFLAPDGAGAYKTLDATPDVVEHAAVG